MTQTVIKIGNSQGIILPKEILEKMKIKKGDSLSVQVEGDQNIIISKNEKKQTAPKVSAEFLEWLEAFNKRYKNALQELSSK